MKLKFEYTPDEVNAVLQAMGEVPSKYGLFPFAQSLIAQARSQEVSAPQDNADAGEPE